MRKFIYVLSFILIFCSIFSLTACKEKEKEPEPETTASTHATKAETSEAVKIVDIPEKIEDRVEMLNSALDYIDVYCYAFTKNTKCTVSNLNLGGLSKASNAGDAFRSIFGEKEVSYDYSYVSAPESFDENVISERFSADDAVSADAKQDGDTVTVTVTLKDEYNPDEKNGLLAKLSSDYLNAEKVKSSLGEFSSSADSVNVSARDIKVKAELRAEDSKLKKLEISYTENFSLSNVKLVQLEGSAVSGTSKTVVTYSKFS